MPRTNASDVMETFDTKEDSDTVDAWIAIAEEFVDDVEEADSSITDSRLEKLEKLVAQHLLATQDQRVESGSQESGQVTFQGETGMHFEASKYGQAAIALDPTGTLAKVGKPTASVTVPNTKGL